MEDVAEEDSVILPWPPVLEHIQFHGVDAILEAMFGNVALCHFADSGQFHDCKRRPRPPLSHNDAKTTGTPSDVQDAFDAVKIAIQGDSHRQWKRLAVHCMCKPFRQGRVHFMGFPQDRKSTRLNSSHVSISYAVFC